MICYRGYFVCFIFYIHCNNKHNHVQLIRKCYFDIPNLESRENGQYSVDLLAICACVANCYERFITMCCL